MLRTCYGPSTVETDSHPQAFAMCFALSRFLFPGGSSWHSGLSIGRCCSCATGCNCGMGLVLGPRAGSAKKKKKSTTSPFPPSEHFRGLSPLSPQTRRGSHLACTTPSMCRLDFTQPPHPPLGPPPGQALLTPSAQHEARHKNADQI